MAQSTVSTRQVPTSRWTPIQRTTTGFLADIVSATVSSPFDVVRITQQVGCGGASESFWSTARSIWETDGFFGFWKGNATQCIKAIPHIAIVFYVRNIIKERFKTPSDSYLIRTLLSLLAGTVGSLVAGSITYPLDVIRVRLIQQRLNNIQYNGPLDCLVKIVHREGISVLFQGLTSLPMQIIPREVGNLVSALILAKLPDHLRAFKHANLAVGFLVNAIGHTISYPFETIGKIVQAQGDLPGEMLPEVRTTSYKQALETLYERDPRRLWQGLSSYLLRCLPHAVASIVTLESTQNFFLWQNGYTQGPFDATPLEDVPQNIAPAELKRWYWDQRKVIV